VCLHNIPRPALFLMEALEVFAMKENKPSSSILV
jgi:hypothetical protein